MKKIVSLLSVALVAMVMLISCASENTKKGLALMDAIKANDLAQVEQLTNELVAVKDQLTGDETVAILTGANFLINKYSQDANAAKVQEYVNLFMSSFEGISAKADAATALETSKKGGADFQAIYDAYKAQIEAAAQAQAEAEAAAQEEAEEGDAEEEIEEVEAE
ncbi:MAG: hypothetical protein MJ211_13485 [Bacteroidales bacterium]|nr:hypothetical protein [Bacteroidales bacterium]